MVFHILTNAIKFNKESNGIIEIILSYVVKKDGNGGGILNCKVCDNGVGMNKMQIEQSFEAFGNVNLKREQGEDSFNALTTSGIGLGISTSYKLAGAMNGNLSIISKTNDEERNEISGT
jgi:two-component system capsular synthesis sensor histidine kinase RcsC